MRFGPQFAALLGGATFRTDWPIHTAGNSENGATLEASSFTVGHEPWHLHDVVSGAGTYFETSGNGAGQWVQVRFDTYRRATHYSATVYGGISADAVTFDLKGSTDGVSFVTLDAGANINANPGGSNISNRPLTIQTPFLIFRMAITGATIGGSNSAARIEHLDFTFSPT